MEIQQELTDDPCPIDTYCLPLTQANRFTRHFHLSPYSSGLCCYAGLRSRYFICSSPNRGIKVSPLAPFHHDDACYIFFPLAPWPLSCCKGVAEPSETNHTTQKWSLISSFLLLSVSPGKVLSGTKNCQSGPFLLLS